MYNKKVLNQATANLNKAKAPVKKSDRIINSNKLLPFISSEGFKQGPPPPGTNYRIPGNTIYNPTPYNIKAVGSNGEEKFIAAGDTTKRTFKDAQYVDEYQMKRGGTPPSLPKKKNSKGYSRSITATNRLFAQNPITKKVKSKKRKVFDPNARYYLEGGDISIPELTEAQEGVITKKEIQDIPEATVYGTDYDQKRQLMLMDRLQQAKGAYQDWRDEAGLRRAQLKNEGSSSIDSLKARVSDYNKQLEEEKKNYNKASKALNILKKYRPDEWKDAKVKDVISGKGIESLRGLYSEGTLTEGAFRDFYNNFGSQYDPNVVEGKGSGKQYSANEARQNWMENVPEFTDKVSKVAAGIALAPALMALGPMGNAGRFSMPGAATTTARVASPFMQAARTAYNNPWIKALPGSSTRNIIAAGYAGKSLSETPQVLKSIGEGYTGEKKLVDVAGDVGEYAFNLATSLPGNNIKNIAGNVVKLVDKPFSQYKLFSQYRKNPVFGPQPLTNFDKFNRSRFNPIGRLPKFSEMRPSDLLRGQTVGNALLNLPETGSNIGKDLQIGFDPNVSMQERSLAQARALRNSIMTGLSLSPVFKKTAPLYGSNFGNRAFLLDNLYKGATEGDPNSTRALLNASRLIAKQKGGTTNSYVSTLPQKKIDELIKQGYKIEYID
jgi:hypothetical protein